MSEGKAAKLPPVQVTFACGHDGSFLAPIPTPGSDVYCRNCQTYTTARVQPEVWVRCSHCTLAKRLGQDIAGARRLASSHALRRGSHIVTVSRGREILERVGSTLEEGQLPYDSILSERRELSRRMQKLLRPKD